MNWDQSYYAQKQQAALFNLTDEDVRPYFAYPTVLAGLHEVGLTLQHDHLILALCTTVTSRYAGAQGLAG